MERIEFILTNVRSRRLIRRRKLEELDIISANRQKMLQMLQDMKGDMHECVEKLIKGLNIITSHKHLVHKIISSSKDQVSGLPIPHHFALDVKTMFTDIVNFINNIEDIQRILNTKNDVESLKLIQLVTVCVESIGNELSQIKSYISQVEALKEDITLLSQVLYNSNITSNESNLTIKDESTDSASTIQ